MKYGPSRGELKFRLAVSLAGLGLTVAALLATESPFAAPLFEVVGVAGLFFGITALWSLRRLMTDARPGRVTGQRPSRSPCSGARP